MYKPYVKEQEVDFAKAEIEFDILLPAELKNLLSELGAGYSKNQELLIFGGQDSSRPLIEWNREIIKIGIFPPPIEGGPVFIAENCIGVQYGFRIENSGMIFIMFDPNAFESYVIANTSNEFINEIISDDELVTLNHGIYSILKEKGPLKAGYHLAPFISPMLGGSLDPNNWSIAPARAHIFTSFEEYKATKST